MVQVQGIYDIGEMQQLLKSGSVFVPVLPAFRGSKEYTVSGEMDIPIELEMLVKYPNLH